MKFVPYIKKVTLNTAEFRFFHATPEAREWYDPLKPYARLEYDWVLENVALAGRNFLDAGAHHGQYAVVIGAAFPDCRIVSVDPLQENIDITEVNLRLNGLNAELVRCVVSDHDGEVRFSDPAGLPGSNGRIVEGGGMVVESRRLCSVMPDANVVKLDVEGEEFKIIADQVDTMQAVDTWIVEVHPFAQQFGGAHPDVLIKEFRQRDFKVLWVNRDKNIVEPYVPGTTWAIHSTIFALK